MPNAAVKKALATFKSFQYGSVLREGGILGTLGIFLTSFFPHKQQFISAKELTATEDDITGQQRSIFFTKWHRKD